MKVIEDRTPIDELLEEQQRLRTPVADFSSYHDRIATPDLEPVYRDLIPLSRPGVGEQYAFEVNMDACTGCKACVTGCHSMNGLEEHETWRDVGLIHSRTGEAYQQTVTSACHHCVEPACMHGCPVLAYEKDSETGIVMHLDDQCIGCQYCVLKCPYDVPKYSEFLGIVRKCDMCHGRLAESEAPACVQACPTSAISITIVDTAGIRQKAVLGEFLPGTPNPEYTIPSTCFVSDKEIPSNAVAADMDDVAPEHAHLPLVFMLVFTQMALGCFLISLIESNPFVVIGGVVSLFVGIGASVLHLGKPLGAWRSFLGLRRSWLSREIVAFGLLLPLAALYLAFPTSSIVAWASVTLCGLGVVSSVMLYADTRRPYWSLKWSGIRFFGTSLVLGCSCWALSTASVERSLTLLAGFSLFKLSLEFIQFKSVRYAKSSKLVRGPLWGKVRTRFLFGALGGVILPLAVLFSGVESGSHYSLVFLSWFLVLAGELLERILYFQAVIAPKMPGGGVR